MGINSPKHFARLSRDCRATVVRRSCECRKLVAAKLWRIYNAKFSRHSYECRASVERRSRDSLAKTSRLSGEKKKTKASISLACEFLATVLRILSRTFARQSCECRDNFLVSRTSRELVAKFFNMLKNFM